MLGRRKRFFEDISFAIDTVMALLLLSSVYLYLNTHTAAWQQFLRDLTGYEFNIQDTSHLSDQSWLLLSILFFHLASFRLSGFYQLDLFADWGKLAVESFKSSVLGVAMTALFLYFFTIVEVNRSLLFGFAGLFWIYSNIKERLYRDYLLHTYYHRQPLEALLVCPASAVASRLERLKQRHLSSARVTQIILSDGTVNTLLPEHQALVNGSLDDLPEALSQGQFDLVFLGEGGRKAETAQQVISCAEEQGIEVWYLADFLEPVLAQPQVDEYGGYPVIVFKTTSHIEGKLLIKRTFDVIVAGAALLLLSPLLLVIVVALKLDSRGPVFFSQERTGYRGKAFKMHKFRTMVVDAEAQLERVRSEANEMIGPVYKRGDDPRITRIGRLLRRYSLDELPQLLNIIKGEMSLVGPRPLPVYETRNFAAFRDHRRYSVLPGLTGLWQISGRNTITDFREWVRLDLEYIDRWSLWLDITIIFKTLPVVLKGIGAK